MAQACERWHNDDARLTEQLWTIVLKLPSVHADCNG